MPSHKESSGITTPVCVRPSSLPALLNSFCHQVAKYSKCRTYCGNPSFPREDQFWGFLKPVLLALIDVDNAVGVSVALFPDCKEQTALLGLIRFSESEYL